MSIFQALRTGFRRMLGRPFLLLGLWLVTVAAALPATWVLRDALRESFEDSQVQENMRVGFDMSWFGEFESDARGLETTFHPSLTGAGAFFKNLEGWLTGEMFDTFPGLIGLGVFYALLWALLLGGVLSRLSGKPERLMQAGGTFFFRFVRLGLLSLPLYYGVYRLYRWSHRWLGDFTRDVTVERTVLFYTLLAVALTGFLLALVHVCFAYAKIATVLEDRRSMVLAALRGLGFVVAHPWRTLGLYYAMALVSALLLLFYTVIAPGADASTLTSIGFVFLVGQAFLIAKLGVRLSLYAGQIALYEGLTRQLDS